MLTKEQFIKSLTELKQLEEDIEKVHLALRKLDPDFGGFYICRLSTLVVDLLQSSMNDKVEDISYFIYELDYGKKWKKGTYTDKDKKDIKLKTMEDLYNLLIKNNKTK